MIWSLEQAIDTLLNRRHLKHDSADQKLQTQKFAGKNINR